MDALREGAYSISAGALALLTLDQLPGVGPASVQKLVERFGTAERALQASTPLFASIVGSEAARARADPTLRDSVERALARAEQLGVKVITWDETEYPPALRHLTDPPPVLFLRGRVELLCREKLVTVVGARRATARARDVAERLGVMLARAGVGVASGMALGVDRAAHEGALRGGGETIAVLGTGPDVVYPRAHARLFQAILDKGLLVSEFLPGTAAAPYHFPRRNRILAALTSTTVVVEAARRSGALITVDHALDLGREVWAVPGPIDASACSGSNRLLVDGARPLVDIGEFVSAVGGSTTMGGIPGLPCRASGPESLILAALADDTLAVDALADRVGLPVAKALALLTTMELHGEVERVPGLRFRRAA